MEVSLLSSELLKCQMFRAVCDVQPFLKLCSICSYCSGMPPGMEGMMGGGGMPGGMDMEGKNMTGFYSADSSLVHPFFQTHKFSFLFPP